MSRKDYVAIAALLSDYARTTSDPTQAEDIAFADLVDGFIHLFQQDNPNFNAERFREAIIPTGAVA